MNSERLAVLELNGTIPASIIVAYTPTNCDKDATKDAFFESIGQLFKSIPANHLTLLMGDFNTEVDTCSTGFEK